MDIAAACQHLFQLDQRLNYGTDYSIDLQATRNQAQRGSNRLGPFITNVNPQVFDRPTFRLFFSLLDNYERKTGTAEIVTSNELQEQSMFLDAIMAAPCMQFVHKWLADRKVIGREPEMFKRALTQTWFALYRRDIQNDSSGFEHVFLGESDDGKIKGLHSWIQFHMEERKGNLQYKGYLQTHGRGNARSQVEPSDAVITVSFDWCNESKPVSSIILGSTPEFEIGLYTLCFLGGTEENLVSLGPFDLKIRAYRIRARNGDKIGSVFPELLSKSEGGGFAQMPQTAAFHPQQPHPAQNAHYGGPSSHAPPGSYAAAAGGGSHQGWNQQQPMHQNQPHYSQQQQYQQHPNQGQSQGQNHNEDDTVSQGCSLLGAFFNMLCGGRNKNRQ